MAFFIDLSVIHDRYCKVAVIPAFAGMTIWRVLRTVPFASRVVFNYGKLNNMQQLIRYGLLGVASNVTAYFIYLLITYLGVEPKTAMTLMYISGATIGFIGNQKWIFAHRGDSTSAALRYLLAHSFGYLLNYLILFFFVDRLGYAHQWVQALAILIVAGFLFVVFKYFVFRERI